MIYYLSKAVTLSFKIHSITTLLKLELNNLLQLLTFSNSNVLWINTFFIHFRTTWYQIQHGKIIPPTPTTPSTPSRRKTKNKWTGKPATSANAAKHYPPSTTPDPRDPKAGLRVSRPNRQAVGTWETPGLCRGHAGHIPPRIWRGQLSPCREQLTIGATGLVTTCSPTSISCHRRGSTLGK